MPRGGKREGSGRKPGGGNRRFSRKIVLDMMERGETPLEYFRSIMHDTTQSTERRDWAAAQAAPYCHPRLQAINMSGETTTSHVVRLPVKSESTEEWLQDYMPTAPVQ